MSIFDKHPAPWTIPPKSDEGAIAGDVFDANGMQVIFGVEAFCDDHSKRLVLAAPELLAALKDVHDDCPDTKDEATWKSERRAEALALISRIEGGNG